MLEFYEFFAGGGMAHAGLGNGWRCTFANDIDAMKCATYRANWGGESLVCADVAKLNVADLPGIADLAWASFPCQDLSLAGEYRGLGTSSSATMTRSGTFWPFWKLMCGLIRRRRGPRLIVLENVYGLLTSHGGTDFAAIASSLANASYSFGAVIIDARLFVPQSRPRVFFIAVRDGQRIPWDLMTSAPQPFWHPKTLVRAFEHLDSNERAKWIWWRIQAPANRNSILADFIEHAPDGVQWHSREETKHLLNLMSPLNKAKVDAAMAQSKRVVGCVYRRTRIDEHGVRQQRAEVRFDDVAGCLRTPGGGSSRQTILVVEGNEVRSRLISPREAARLMGLDDGYKLPQRYNDAYHVAGDGVCVPVVRHIASNLLTPILSANGLPKLNVAA